MVNSFFLCLLMRYRHVQVGTLRVLKYHGPKREADIYKLLDYDIVLTTVPTLSADFAKKCSSLRLIHWYRLIVDEGADGPMINF